MKYFHPRKAYNLTNSFFRNLMYWIIPDKIFLKWEYSKEHNGLKANVDNPQTIDEKLMWIKLYDRKPIYHTMIDKIEAKKFITSVLGTNKYIIPTLATYNTFQEIVFDKLPNQFVLKCNHDSGSYVIVRDKSKLDVRSANYRLSNALKYDYYRGQHKQWGYTNIKRKIFAEKYIDVPFLEYQVFCNNGVPVFFLVRSDLAGGGGRPFAVCYSTDWQKKDYRTKNYPDIQLDKPQNFDEMLRIAQCLSANTLHLRVDFYETINGELYIGELTFYSHGGIFDNFNDKGKKILTETLNLDI